MKSIQIELDNLIKRVKINETAFYELNKTLSNIPGTLLTKLSCNHLFEFFFFLNKDPLPLIELIINLNSDFNDKF